MSDSPAPVKSPAEPAPVTPPSAAVPEPAKAAAVEPAPTTDTRPKEKSAEPASPAPVETPAKQPTQAPTNTSPQQNTAAPAPGTEASRNESKPGPLDHIVGTGTNSMYIKKKLLGQGSFGTAWRVEDAANGMVCAAKIMDTNAMTAKDRGFVANEVKCLARCNHPNIIKHIMSTDIDGMLLIVMEFADGGDLYKQIKARQNSLKYFKEHEVLFIFLQLCLALDHIHSKRMMHRDLKTANVLLTTTGLVKLGDFGFSRQYEDSLSNPVGSTFCGTPYYLSPELWKRAPYSKKAEMWALGVVLYEVMALKRPFGGKNMDELIDNILHARYEPLPSHFSPELRDLVGQLLSLDPGQRPSLRRMFTFPYIRNNGLLTLRRSVEHHSRIPASVRAELCKSVDDILNSGYHEYDAPHVEPRTSMLKRHYADVGWKDCELSLTSTAVQMRDPHKSTAGTETMDLTTLTSVCPIDPSIANEHFVFALKNQTGRAFWFKEANVEQFNEWLTALQNAMPY